MCVCCILSIFELMHCLTGSGVLQPKRNVRKVYLADQAKCVMSIIFLHNCAAIVIRGCFARFNILCENFACTFPLALRLSVHFFRLFSLPIIQLISLLIFFFCFSLRSEWTVFLVNRCWPMEKLCGPLFRHYAMCTRTKHIKIYTHNKMPRM